MRIQPLVFLLALFAALGCGGSDPEGSGGAWGPGGIEAPTAERVCRLWAEGHVENEERPWAPGADICDLGTLSEVAIEDTLRRINLFRTLAGLPPVTEDREQRARTQACAVLMNANDDLSHEPPKSWHCWSEEGAAGAASSNISLGRESPGDAIDGFMQDVGVKSMGHRRWLLGFVLGKVGIGFAGKGTCIGVFDDTGQTDRAWTAYPPAGPTPIDMVIDPWGRQVAWSFHPADGIAGARVFMQRLPDEDPVRVSAWLPDTGHQIPDAIVWQPPPVEAGESYRITIVRPEKELVTYDVELVDCAD